jgi:hypothetical protein
MKMGLSAMAALIMNNEPIGSDGGPRIAARISADGQEARPWGSRSLRRSDRSITRATQKVSIGLSPTAAR